MDSKFSLVMATINRFEEVRNFLISIDNQKYSKELIEIIVVDQNSGDRVTRIVEEFSHLNIKYIKSKIKGLSQNRNIGLRKCTGDIVAFPDDDCEYLPDTLVNVNKAFQEDENCKIIMGKIVERDGTDSLRVWPKNSMVLSKTNFYTKCSSVTMFIRESAKDISFNERLGAGNYFGACEDTNLLYQFLKLNEKVVYIPIIAIYHPHYSSSNNMSLAKVYSYGLGFGAFCRINFDIYKLWLFFKAQAYHFLNTLFGVITFNKTRICKGYAAFSSRLNGFFKYNKTREE